MDNSIGVGFMAVVAVSGSVVLLAHQVHKRLLSDFMKNIECEMGGLLDHHKKMASGSEKIQGKKCVRFAADVAEPSSNNKEYRKRRFAPTTKQAKEGNGNYKMDTMPLNRQALYKGIIEFKSLKGAHVLQTMKGELQRKYIFGMGKYIKGSRGFTLPIWGDKCLENMNLCSLS
ncbi:PREDICTED: transmembrane [Prunus dulcis]|uniref:PREDICTED: transmembrane n=1 Tax=Prunus dulcis TaxID=3755 RepID=A0A5E4EI78_PRUDU|nr:hypothetical protein L3X38_038498 [Prunus dulcis]VVA15334.1 PREDICTED: transmembrane [Prunus dulcis]